MKKIVLSLAALAIVVSLASCKKTCNCKRWEASKVVEEKEMDLGDKDKCSDLNSLVQLGELKAGWECE
ncbi:MAG: hypothetical protein J6X35_12290 [Bacteroidales bacterium]|nr:hypothetical protein [Bacteroidales bacterium]MBP5614908.1 hypothetical protein [Bacteroidales bacterium]